MAKIYWCVVSEKANIGISKVIHKRAKVRSAQEGLMLCDWVEGLILVRLAETSPPDEPTHAPTISALDNSTTSDQ